MKNNTSSVNTVNTGHKLRNVGINIIRYGLVLVIGWIGIMKFTSVEARAIMPLVENSPLMNWVYDILSVQGFSNILGSVEIIIAVMIAFFPVSKKVSAIGCLLAVFLFLTTLTFIFSTPGWEPTLGFPALSVVPGQFLIKDIVNLGAAIFLLGESIK